MAIQIHTDMGRGCSLGLDGSRTLIMGILNVTPDSFSDGGRHETLDAAVSWAEQLIADGADIIDVGGESTRPGAAAVDEAEELRRILPVVEALARRHPSVPISVDTWKSGVARQALSAGASIINDISGLKFDEDMGKLAAGSGAHLIAMHLTGASPERMHELMGGGDPVERVAEGLSEAVQRALTSGISRERLILDPGIGFGKTAAQNVEILRRLPELRQKMGLPILVGASRKRFLGELTGRPADERQAGDAAVTALCAERGADIVRVHDVRTAADAIRVGRAFREGMADAGISPV